LNPVFSPDGAQIAFWSQSDATIKRIARGGGAAVTVCKTASVWGMDWTEHGIVFGAGSQGVMIVPAGGGTPAPVATISAGEIASMPSLLPDGDAIVFGIKQDSQSWDQGRIVLQDIGGARTTLIEGGADPRVLPSGHLLFARSGSVMAVRFDPRQRRVVGAAVPVIEGVRRGAQSPTGPTGVAHFSYSTNGVLTYVPGPANASGEARNQYDLGIFDLGGVVRSLRLAPRDYRNPRVSPDGKFVAFHLEDDKEAAVWTYEIAGGRTPLRLTFSGRNRYAEWSADSRWVLFQSDRDGDIAIFRQLADGSGQAERLTKPEPNVVHEPLSVSPDGKYLLFSVGELRGVPTSLSLLSLSDRRVQRLAGLGSTERADGAFSPDGKWLVYQTRESGSPRRVYVEPFPRTGAKYLVGEGGHPFWNGDGIIVNSGPGSSVRIPFLTAPRIGVGDPVTISRAGRIETNPTSTRRNADTLPGGTQYLGIVGDPMSTAASTDMVVVLNWFSDLKQRLPRE
jgi:Tol biopolymer transport system component